MEIARCSEFGQLEQLLQFYELANEVSKRPIQTILRERMDFRFYEPLFICLFNAQLTAMLWFNSLYSSMVTAAVSDLPVSGRCMAFPTTSLKRLEERWLWVLLGFSTKSCTDTNRHERLPPGPVDNTMLKISTLTSRERHKNSTQEAFKINLIETYYKSHICVKYMKIFVKHFLIVN